MSVCVCVCGRGGGGGSDVRIASTRGRWRATMQGRGTDSHGSSVSSGSSQRQAGVVCQPGENSHFPVLLPRHAAWRDAQPSPLGRLCGSVSGEASRTSSRVKGCARIGSWQYTDASLPFHEKCSSVRRCRRPCSNRHRSTARTGSRPDDLPRQLCTRADRDETLSMRCSVRGAATHADGSSTTRTTGLRRRCTLRPEGAPLPCANLRAASRRR